MVIAGGLLVAALLSFGLYAMIHQRRAEAEFDHERDPKPIPLAPIRALAAAPSTPEAASAGLALSRWRGQLANNTGWNDVTSDKAATPEEPSLPGRDLPNPDVDTRAIKRAAETNRPLLIGPAEVAAPIEMEMRERLGKLKSLHASGA